MELTELTLNAARQLLRGHDLGVLSTLSQEMDGSPFGSLATYCLDRSGSPIVLFSTIAEHSKNLAADARCALTVLENAGGNVQAEGRITLNGSVVKLKAEDPIGERYYQYFPEAREYHKFHDFDFFRIELSQVRYIGGFGKIHWIEPAQLCKKNPFTRAEEEMILSHMNSDHRDSLLAYFRHLKGMTLKGDEEIVMCGIDSDGFEMRLNGHLHRFEVDTPMVDAQVAREVLTALAKSHASNKPA